MFADVSFWRFCAPPGIVVFCTSCIFFRLNFLSAGDLVRLRARKQTNQLIFHHACAGFKIATKTVVMCSKASQQVLVCVSQSHYRYRSLSRKLFVSCCFLFENPSTIHARPRRRCLYRPRSTSMCLLNLPCTMPGPGSTNADQ